MKKSCSDSKMRDLLHAYELGMISGEEKDTFEAHLLECEVCFEQLKEFAPRGHLLKTSAEIRQLLDEVYARESESVSFWRRLWQMIWPDSVPVVLKPAILAAILLIALYPAYLGMRGGKVDTVQVVEEISLIQLRSPQTFEIDAGRSVVLSFLCPDGTTGETYHVSLVTGDGQSIYVEEKYSDVDSYGIGRILLPGHMISSGTYRLTVKANVPTSDDSREADYVFHIKITDRGE